MYSGIDELKSLIRETFKNKIDNYLFDNIFHMTDDEDEYYELNPIIEEYKIFKNKRDNGRLILPKKLFKQRKKRYGTRNIYEYDKWFFKETRLNSYEDYTELFAEEIFKYFGINNTFYDLATLDNKKGVISYDFRNNNEYVVAKDIISEVINSDNINEIIKYNNINSLRFILEEYTKKHNLKIDIKSTIKSLEKLILIDMLLLQNDRNPNNYGFIIKNNELVLTRVFDNSNAVSSNHIDRNPLDSFPLLTIDQNTFASYYDEIENNRDFYQELLNYIKEIENNLDDFFTIIENKIESPLPEEYKLYIKENLKKHFTNIKEIYKEKTLVLNKKSIN